MLFMTDFPTASKRLNLNNPTQGTQCGVNQPLTSQRLEETRHGYYLAKISHTLHKSVNFEDLSILLPF